MADGSNIHDRPTEINPTRVDPPGSVTSMPSPSKVHHVHIFTEDRYEEMIEFYSRLFDAEVVAEHVHRASLSFLSYDDHDHRVVIIKRGGLTPKTGPAVGVSHVAFGYASLGELIYIYKRLKEWGYDAPHWTVNHGNSTSFYYRDPDGNEVETMCDNFAPIDTQRYKRNYQFTEEFGEMSEGNFDPDKMVALYESGVPDSVLMDREEVRRMVREGTL